MKKAFLGIVAIAVVALTGHQAHGLSLELKSPSIFWPKGYDKNRADKVLHILQDKKLSFLGGLTSYWEPDFSTTLVYGGDTKSLKGFISQLRQVPGLHVKLTFSNDLSRETGSALRAGSWWVKYSHVTPDTLTIRINLAAKEIDLEKLVL
jgi:hypothetical protein